MEIRDKILKITGGGEGNTDWTGWYDWSQVTVRPGSPSYNIRSVERFSCTTAANSPQLGSWDPNIVKIQREILQTRLLLLLKFYHKTNHLR